MTSVCNTGAMAQLAGAQNSALMSVLHGSSTPSSFLYSYKPEAMYAIDTDVVPLGSGTLTNNASEVYETDVPNTFDLVTGCTLLLSVPAIVNVSSGTCDLAGSAVNASSNAKVRAYVDGPEADAATRERRIVYRGTTTADTAGSSLSYLPMSAPPSLVKEGDWFVATPRQIAHVHGILAFPAANVTAPGASVPIANVTLQGFLGGTPQDLVFGALYTALDHGVSNVVTFGGVVGTLTFHAAVTGSFANIGINNHPIADSFVVNFVPSNTSVTLTGRVGRIDGSIVYDYGAASINKIGGVVYDVLFTRDTNLNAFIGDSSVEIPCSEPDARFTKFYEDGPNLPAETSQGLLCPAAGFKSDIAAYYHTWAPVQFIRSATLTFDGVCADTLTGTAIQIYHDLYQKPCDKNERLLNACTDMAVLKVRARQPQQFEVSLPFSFFRDSKLALNMELFKYTNIKLKLVTNPYSQMVANGCGSSDFRLTITSDNALGGSSPRTLVTKSGSLPGSAHAFCDSKGALSYASAQTLAAKDVWIRVRWAGCYLPKADRDRLTQLTPPVMVVQQHSASEPLTVTTAGQHTIEVPGNNALSSIVVVAQTRSALNQGRLWDFRGHAIAGTGTQSGAFVQRAPLIETVRLVCQGKNRTQLLAGHEALAIAFQQGAVANSTPTTDYVPFCFGTANPYDSPQNLNAQTIPDIKAQIKIASAVFQNNSASGGFDGKSKVAAAGSASVDGGESVTVRVLVTQHNVIRIKGQTIQFEYPF